MPDTPEYLRMVALVGQSGIFREVAAARAGATITCHSGPGILGLLCLEK